MPGSGPEGTKFSLTIFAISSKALASIMGVSVSLSRQAELSVIQAGTVSRRSRNWIVKVAGGPELNFTGLKHRPDRG